ncbi:hypothetical protein V1278_006413 [Bradyrhizobium sp. AZCC 1577]
MMRWGQLPLIQSALVVMGPCVRRDDSVFRVNRYVIYYCTPSATNRNSPSPFDTSSSTDFLPSFLS